jgi:hypothetical protein
LTKIHSNKNKIACYSSIMFYTNILLHDKKLDPNSSITRNMALTIGIPLSTKKQGLFFTFIAYIK